MTLVNALETLKEKGVTRLTGMYNQWDIDRYIENAQAIHDNHIKYSDVPSHRYSLDHEDEHFIVETNDHYIIATHYDGHSNSFDMATYGDYETEEQMHAAFEEWKIGRDAEEIADKMVKERPGELPREVWVQITTHELREANKEAELAFERDFPSTEASGVQNNQPGYKEYSEPATAENSPDQLGVPSDDVNAYLPEQSRAQQEAQLQNQMNSMEMG